ncbi:hypothetical protein [Halomontanus rarus]|uniref:hypothetical protein n=1 Tax=Halomontanus rarus TaxID=3034020 RepID=UPI00307B81F7
MGSKPKPKLKPKPKPKLTPTPPVRRTVEQYTARAELESSVAADRPLYLYLQVELVPRWAS